MTDFGLDYTKVICSSFSTVENCIMSLILVEFDNGGGLVLSGSVYFGLGYDVVFSKDSLDHYPTGKFFFSFYTATV